MELFKKHFTLIVGISIPIVMILLVATSIYLPGLFTQPKYNFLYVTDENRFGGEQYFVEGGKLIREYRELEEYESTESTPRLFIHDVVRDESREIPFEEAVQLRLDSDEKSPDGFSITYGSQGGSFLFWFGSYSDYDTQYIVGKGFSKKLDLENGSYYSDFGFLGWVLP